MCFITLNPQSLNFYCEIKPKTTFWMCLSYFVGTKILGIDFWFMGFDRGRNRRWGLLWSLLRIWLSNWWKIRRKGIGNLGSTCILWRTGVRRRRRCGVTLWGHMGFGHLNAIILSLLGMLRLVKLLVEGTLMMMSSRKMLVVLFLNEVFFFSLHFLTFGMCVGFGVWCVDWWFRLMLRNTPSVTKYKIT